MIKRKKKIRKNPYISNYGYHLTTHQHIDSILKKGLKPSTKDLSFLYARKAINELIYRGNSPIYFLDLPNLNKISKKLKDYIRINKSYILLKVNTNNFEQLADVYSLYADFGLRIHPDPEMLGTKLDNNSVIYGTYSNPLPKVFKQYANEDDEIKILDFIKDEQLAIDTIFFTETFCINEIISPVYIEEIIDMREIVEKL